MMAPAFGGAFMLIWAIFFIIGLAVSILSIYALVLLIKALKIYIEKNSKLD